jgi:hypothetical protein
VQIAGREKFSSTRSDPAIPSSGLTLRQWRSRQLL